MGGTSEHENHSDSNARIAARHREIHAAQCLREVASMTPERAAILNAEKEANREAASASKMIHGPKVVLMAGTETATQKRIREDKERADLIAASGVKVYNCQESGAPLVRVSQVKAEAKLLRQKIRELEGKVKANNASSKASKATSPKVSIPAASKIAGHVSGLDASDQKTTAAPEVFGAILREVDGSKILSERMVEPVRAFGQREITVPARVISWNISKVQYSGNGKETSASKITNIQTISIPEKKFAIAPNQIAMLPLYVRERKIKDTNPLYFTHDGKEAQYRLFKGGSESRKQVEVPFNWPQKSQVKFQISFERLCDKCVREMIEAKTIDYAVKSGPAGVFVMKIQEKVRPMYSNGVGQYIPTREIAGMLTMPVGKEDSFQPASIVSRDGVDMLGSDEEIETRIWVEVITTTPMETDRIKFGARNIADACNKADAFFSNDAILVKMWGPGVIQTDKEGNRLDLSERLVGWKDCGDSATLNREDWAAMQKTPAGDVRKNVPNIWTKRHPGSLNQPWMRNAKTDKATFSAG